jgi:hypothetical protein
MNREVVHAVLKCFLWHYYFELYIFGTVLWVTSVELASNSTHIGLETKIKSDSICIHVHSRVPHAWAGPCAHVHVAICPHARCDPWGRGHVSMFTEPHIHMHMIMLLRYQRARDRLQKLHNPRVP